MVQYAEDISTGGLCCQRNDFWAVWEIGRSPLKTGDPVGLDTAGRANPNTVRLKDMDKPFINELHTSAVNSQ